MVAGGGGRRSHRLSARVDDAFMRRVEAQAAFERVTPSELARNALQDYLDRDVAWQGQVQGALESMRSNLGRVEKEVKLLSALFLHWTEYYFTYTRPLGGMDESAKRVLVAEGRERSRRMVEALKRSIREGSPGLMEILLADYISRPVGGEEP